VLSSTAGVNQNVLRIVKDRRPRRRQDDDPMHVNSTENGELPLDAPHAASSSRIGPVSRATTSRNDSLFDDDDVLGPTGKHSKFSDDESGDDFLGSDGDSSGIGSDDLTGQDDLDEEEQMYVRSAAPRESGWVEKSKPSRTFVHGGYDYGIHMKPTGTAPGAVFVSKDGRISMVGEEEDENTSTAQKRGAVAAKRTVENPQLLPEELFASKPSKDAVKADAHDKLFGAIGEIDPEVQRLLDSDNEDESDGELDPEDTLDDDFVMQAIQPGEGEEMDALDARAYLDRIIRTGMLPGEVEDPFGDELEDIDSFLDQIPKGSSSKSSSTTKGGKPKKTSSSLDDIDDDKEGSGAGPGRGAKKVVKVRFDVGDDSEEFEEDEEDGEFDSDVFSDDEDDETLDSTQRKAKQIGRSIPGRAPLSAEEAARAMHRFETTLADYDETMELEGDDPAVQGMMDVNDFHDVLDQFLDDAVLLGLRSANAKGELNRRKMKTGGDAQSGAASASAPRGVLEMAASISTGLVVMKGVSSSANGDDENVENVDEDDEENGAGTFARSGTAHVVSNDDEGEQMYSGDEAMAGEEKVVMYVEGRGEAQWDVESYVSTYTNTENHPRLVEESSLNRRIQIGRGGVPTGVLQHERKKSAKEAKMRQREEDEAALAMRDATREKVNLGAARPKTETAEERRVRKEAQKLEKRVNRETKRQLKDSFRQESARQQRQNAGNSRATIVHL